MGWIAYCRKPPLESYYSVYDLSQREVVGIRIRTAYHFSFQLLAYFFVMACFFPGYALALDVTLAWDQNDEEVVGYRLYYGRESRNYSTVIDVGEDTSHRITDLEDDRTYFFAVTAYDSTNRESAHSEEIAYPYTSSMNLLAYSGFESGSLNEWIRQRYRFCRQPISEYRHLRYQNTQQGFCRTDFFHRKREDIPRFSENAHR